MSNKIILFFPKLDIEAMLLPASVLYVAVPLVEAGYEVKIIDQRVDKDWMNTLLQELKTQPLAVGFSVLTGKQILYGLEASKIVKENSNTFVVWGGVHPSLLPEQTLQNPYIDFVIIGEGEYSFLNLIKRLKIGESYEDLNGLGYERDGQIFCNPQTNFINLDDLPELPYHLINIENYISKTSFASGRLGRNIAFYTSRGCPHRCGFCYNKEFNKRKWRGESAERVVEKIQKMVTDYGITALEIEDDEFFANPERARKIAQMIVNQDIKIEIFTTCRINYVTNFMDDDYLSLLKRAGFRTLAFGVESGSLRIQKLINKDITNEQVLEAIKKLKKAGIDSKYYFMVGFPTEALEDIYATTDLIQKMKEADHEIRVAPWRIYTPYPGTDLYEASVKQGFSPPRSLEKWADYDFNTIKMSWINSRLEKIIKNVIFLNRFTGLKDKKMAGIYGQLIKFYGRIADFRWNKHLFSFVPEKYLILAVSKLKNKLFLYP